MFSKQGFPEWGAWGEPSTLPLIQQFFLNPPTPQSKPMPPMAHLPLKNEVPHLKNNPPIKT